MSHDDIEVSDKFGCVLVRATDKAGMEHRWWFDETDAGRLVFVTEVVHYDKDTGAMVASGRHYVPEDEASVPPRIEEALDRRGHEGLVDIDGRTL